MEHRQHLRVNDPPTLWSFGASVGVSGDFAIMGAWSVGGPSNPALAVIYERNGAGTWLERQQLFLASGDSREFNVEVAISGTAIFVGSPYEEKAGNFRGVVYVLSLHESGDFHETQTLTAPDGEAADHFGVSVAISGDIAVVGTLAEVAYVYTRDADGYWSFLERLSHPMPASTAFGFSSATDGSTFVVGAFLDGTLGSAFVFGENGAGGSGGCAGSGQGGTAGQSGSTSAGSPGATGAGGSSGAEGSATGSSGSEGDSAGCACRAPSPRPGSGFGALAWALIAGALGRTLRKKAS